MNTLSSRLQLSTCPAVVGQNRPSYCQCSVPSTGRGGTASTSGRSLAPARALLTVRLAVHNDAASLHQDVETAEPALTPRRMMNRRIKSCKSLAALCNLVLEDIKSFDQQNASHALARLAKMFHKRTQCLDETTRRETLLALQPAVDALTKRVQQLIGNCESWDLTQSLWAYGQLGRCDEAALRTLCEAALEAAPIFKPADCANTVVAFANLDFAHRELLKQIVTTVLDTIEDFQPGEIAQMLWGFARLGCHPGETFLVEMVEAVQWRMQYYSSQELVLVLWALVRLRHRPGPRFLQAAEATLLQRLPHLVPADVCVAVWSFAHLRYKAVRLLDEVPQALVPQLHACKNAELCALVSAFATSHHYHRVLLDAVAALAVGRMESFSPREVCVLLWTYGAFHHRPSHPEFGRCLAAALAQRMRQFTPQGLAMIAKALWQLQWRSEPLLAQLVGAAEAQLAGFKPLELSQLLWGLSALQWRSNGIYYAVVRRCIAILQDERHPHHRTMMQHRIVNSVVGSCQQLGYVPWTLIDFAESKGIRVRQPGVLSSRDEDDEGVAPAAAAPSAAVAAPADERLSRARAEAEPSGGRAGGEGWEGRPLPSAGALDEEEDEGAAGSLGWRYDVGRRAAHEAAMEMEYGRGSGRWQQQQQPHDDPSASAEEQAHAWEQAELLRQRAAGAAAAAAAAAGGAPRGASAAADHGGLLRPHRGDVQPARDVLLRQPQPPHSSPRPQSAAHTPLQPLADLDRLDGLLGAAGSPPSEQEAVAAAVAEAEPEGLPPPRGAVRVLAPRPRARRPPTHGPVGRSSVAVAAPAANGTGGGVADIGHPHLQRPLRPELGDQDGGDGVAGSVAVAGAAAAAAQGPHAPLPAPPSCNGHADGTDGAGGGGGGGAHHGVNGAPPAVPPLPRAVTLGRRPYTPTGQQPATTRRAR